MACTTSSVESGIVATASRQALRSIRARTNRASGKAKQV
jgi:hypothetical protein